jgi:hypothetical protein
MMLLRREPREVYRVYSEDEFFECAAADEPSVATATGAERRHRAAGVTMLLAAVGAVGGLIAIASLTPAARSGRRTGGLLAAARPSAASRLQSALVWRQSANAAGLRPRSAPPRQMPRAHRSRRVTAPARGTVAARSHNRVARVPAVPILAPAQQRLQVVAAAGRVEVATSAPVGRNPSPSRSGASEFGFER